MTDSKQPRIGFFDIETDNLLGAMTKFHVGVTKINGNYSIYTCPKAMMSALNTQCDIIVGHNCLLFDLPALEFFAQPLHPEIRILDTCVMSRLLWPDRSTHPAGGSSLARWGDFLQMPKGNHTDFSVLSPEMMQYCRNDVDITEKLYYHLIQASLEVPTALTLEHDVARIIGRQQANGFGFDRRKAEELMVQLTTGIQQLTDALQQVFPPKKIQLKTKVREIPFNPGSRDMIAAALMKKYKWRPVALTDTGKPRIDESVLASLPYLEAKLLLKYLLLDKRKSQLGSWIDAEVNNRIHGSVNTNGAVSGRMTHSGPNMAQVPRCGSPYGSECRALFGPTVTGFTQVGADASGLELRMFAHYLAPYDGGQYAKVVCEGDVHTHNQTMAGLKTRDQAKTFIYGLLYGAGDAKIGTIVDGSVRDGARLKQQFKTQVPAYAKLLNQLEFVTSSRGFLRGLDGRSLPVRSAHSALNLLLQSAGAVVMKKALVLLDARLSSTFGSSKYAFMANIHDEWQIECDPTIADEVGRMACQAITDAGIELKLSCPLKGEYKIGNNWAETH